MNAVRLLEYGGQLVFNDVPTPTIARDEILVKIKSTAVNHLDLVEASGTLRQILPIDLPWIPGHKFSGVVNRLAVTLRHVRQVMPCSVPLAEWVPTRSIWLSRRRSSQGNHAAPRDQMGTETTKLMDGSWVFAERQHYS